MNPFPLSTIETKRLILRKVTMNDAHQMYHNWANDQEVTKYLRWQPHQNIEETKRIISIWISKQSQPYFYNWVIVYKENNDVIGTIDLFNVDFTEKSCELGYCLSRKYWNQGIMSEACRGVLDFAFHKVNFKTVHACHFIDNSASGKVMEKNKMKYYKTTSEFDKLRNTNILLKHYKLNKEDFI